MYTWIRARPFILKSRYRRCENPTLNNSLLDVSSKLQIRNGIKVNVIQHYGEPACIFEQMVAH